MMGEISDKKNRRALKDSTTRKRQQARVTALTKEPAASTPGRGPRLPLGVLSTEMLFHTPTARPFPCLHLPRGFSSGRHCRDRKIIALQPQEAWGLRMEHGGPKAGTRKKENSHPKMC